MDTGEGRFKEFSGKNEDELAGRINNLQKEYPKHGGVFVVGEILELKGSKFRVKSIKPTELRLKLLPKK